MLVSLGEEGVALRVEHRPEDRPTAAAEATSVVQERLATPQAGVVR
jgi:hypothetical protein